MKTFQCLAVTIAVLIAVTCLPSTAAAAKLRVAVLDMDFNVTGYDSTTGRGIGAAAADMLARQLLQTGKVIIVDKNVVQRVIDEESSGSGLREDRPGAKWARLSSLCDYLILGSVGDYRLVLVRDMKVGQGGTPYGVYRQVGIAAVEFRIVSTEDGSIQKADRASAERSGNSVGTSPDPRQLDYSLASTAMEDAVHTCASEVAAYFPLQGSVLVADPTNIVIDLGSRSGLRIGDELIVYHVREIKDDKGVVQYTKREEVGRIAIVDIQSDRSMCRVVRGCVGIAKGDMVQRA